MKLSQDIQQLYINLLSDKYIIDYIGQESNSIEIHTLDSMFLNKHRWEINKRGMEKDIPLVGVRVIEDGEYEPEEQWWDTVDQ